MGHAVLYIPIALLIAAVVAGTVCKALYDQMKTARERTEANDYVQLSSLVVERSCDHHLGTHVSKVPIDNGRGGPGGGGHGLGPGPGGFGGHGGPRF